MKKILFNKRKDIVIYLMFTVLLVLVFSYKQNMHVDELLSYGLANNDGPWMIITDNVKYCPADTAVSAYLESDGHFNIKNVWLNQAGDNHPPVYYLLLHIICTLFPNTFSMWYGGVINIFFLLVTFFFYRRLVSEFVEDSNVRTLLSIAFIFSAGILATVLFLRMYVMAMTYVTFLTYYVVKLNNSNIRVRDGIVLLFTSLAGILTHYYCLMYAGIISSVFVVILLRKREYKSMCIFGFSMMGSVLTALILFPYMLQHLLSSSRGVESFANLFYIQDIGHRFKAFWGILENEMFGGLLKYYVIFMLLILIFVRTHRTEEQDDVYGYLLVFIPTAAYLILVLKMAPYETERYLFPIFAVLLAGVFCMISQCIYSWFNNSMYRALAPAFMCAFITIFIGSSWHTNSWCNSFQFTKEGIERAKNYHSSDCVCIYDSSSYVLPLYLEIENYNSITYYNINNPEISKFDYNQDEPLIVVLANGVDDEYISTIQNLFPQLTECIPVASNGGSSSYALKKN